MASPLEKYSLFKDTSILTNINLVQWDIDFELIGNTSNKDLFHKGKIFPICFSDNRVGFVFEDGYFRIFEISILI